RQPGTTASVSRAVCSDFPNSRRVHVPRTDAKPAGDDLDSLFGLARNRASDLFFVLRAAQQASPRTGHWDNRRRSAAADQDLARQCVVMDRLARDPLSRQLSRNVASDLLYYTSGHEM